MPPKDRVLVTQEEIEAGSLAMRKCHVLLSIRDADILARACLEATRSTPSAVTGDEDGE